MYSIVYPGICKRLYVERCNWQERHRSVIHHLHCTFFYILESSALWALPRVPCTMYNVHCTYCMFTLQLPQSIALQLYKEHCHCNWRNALNVMFRIAMLCSPAITYLILYALQLVPKSCAVLCLPWNLQMRARLPIHPLYVERCHCNERQSSTVHCLVSYLVL